MPIKRRPSDDDDRPRRSRDEEDEKPSRSRARDEEEDEPPRSTRRAARDEEEDERPARRSRRDEEDEESRPTRAARRDAEEEDEKPRRRAARDEDDEDEKPRNKRARDEDADEDADEAPSRSIVKAGWGAAKRAREESGDFLQEFKFGKAAILVKFLDDEPFAVYPQHWIEGLRSTKKKSFICMGKKEGCPLCKIGDKPDSKFAFNVAVLDAKDEPAVRALIAGPRLLGILEENNDGTTGPLTKHYWTINRSGKGTNTGYPMQVVKGRDLREDFDLDEEVVEEDLEKVVRYTAKDIQISRKGELQKIVDDINGDEPDDDDDDDEPRSRSRR